MSRLRVVLTGVLVLAAVSWALPGSARADGDPAGTIVLDTGPSGIPKYVVLQAATPDAVVYADERGLVSQRRGSGATVVISVAGAGVASAAGSLLIYRDNLGTHWFDTANNRSGPAPVAWRAAAPTGGLVLDRLDPQTVRLSLQNFVTGRLRTLADIPYDGADTGPSLRPGPDGVVVSYQGADPDASFVGYVAYAGGGLRTYDLAAVPADGGVLACYAPTATHIVCQRSSHAFVMTIGGTAASLLAERPARFPAGLSSEAFVWQACNGINPDGTYRGCLLRSVPLDGGPVSTATVPGLSRELVSDGESVFALLGSTPADAGIYATPDAPSPPALVAPVGAAPYGATQIAIAPGGRVLYTDNGARNNPLWQQVLSPGPGAIVTSGPQRITSGVTGTGLFASGARTGYGTTTHYPAGGVVLSPLQPTVDRAGQPVGVSGDRAVFGTVDFTRGAVLVDLVTGTSTPTATFGDASYPGSLWGDYYTYLSSDGSVRRKNLTSTATPVRLIPAQAFVGLFSPIVSWGDWVAVPRIDDRHHVISTTVLDVRTGALRVLQDEVAIGADAAGYVSRGGSTLTSWDGTQSVTVPGTRLVATASQLAWVGDDGRPRAAPVPWATPDPPRSLGDPTAPSSAAAGVTWTFDLPTSAPLTSCSVDLLRGVRAVRTLSCDAALAAGGDAVVRWDTTDAAGAPAPAGAYVWRVNASNADGPLQLGTGAAGTVSGRFTLAVG